jgi:nucleoid DNA-binding protein
MITIEEILIDLLLHHSCVIIPKFGGFVTRQTSSKIDLERNLVTPPSKQLLFNKHLIANDGLLVNELANKNKLSFQESESHIASFVGEINQQLKIKKQFQLQKIGIFHLDTEGNINFEQDRYFNFLLSAYGLSSVQFVSKSKVEKIEVEVDKETETPIIPIEQGKSNFWKYAVAACLMPIAFYSIWIPTRSNVIESGLISHKDFNPFYKQQSGSYSKKPLGFSKEIQPKSFEEKISKIPNSYFASFQVDANQALTIRMEEKSAPEPISIEESIPKQTVQNIQFQVTNDSKNYQYVLGCFANPSNADNLFNKLKSAGFKVNKSTSGSLIRVSIGSTDDMDSLQQAISKANSLGYQGWVLKN